MPKTRPKISSVKKKSTAGKKACTICGDHFRPQRFSAHLRKCEREKKDAKDKLEYEKELFSKTLAVPSKLRTAVGTSPEHGDHHIAPELERGNQLEFPAPDNLDDPTAIPNISTATHTQTEFHPNSGKPAEIVDTPSSSQAPTELWSPFFATREDFLVSEIILEAALSEKLSDRLLKIFELCQTGKRKVTLTKFTQVETTWQHASVQLGPMEK